MRRLELAGGDFAALVHSSLADGGQVEIEAHGRSMAPALRHGDCVTLEAARRSTVVVGDIVLCELNGRLLLHRARIVGQAGVIVQGDALAVADGLVEWNSVLARIIHPPRKRSGRGWIRRLLRRAA